jgi:hypothetical protein
MASVMSAATCFLLVNGGRSIRAATTSCIGLLLVFATIGGISGAGGIDPAAMLANFCPCVGRWDCSTPFGDDGQNGLQGILEVSRFLFMIFVNFQQNALAVHYILLIAFVKVLASIYRQLFRDCVLF